MEELDSEEWTKHYEEMGKYFSEKQKNEGLTDQDLEILTKYIEMGDGFLKILSNIVSKLGSKSVNEIKANLQDFDDNTLNFICEKFALDKEIYPMNTLTKIINNYLSPANEAENIKALHTMGEIELQNVLEHAIKWNSKIITLKSEKDFYSFETANPKDGGVHVDRRKFRIN